MSYVSKENVYLFQFCEDDETVLSLGRAFRNHWSPQYEVSFAGFPCIKAASFFSEVKEREKKKISTNSSNIYLSFKKVKVEHDSIVKEKKEVLVM